MHSLLNPKFSILDPEDTVTVPEDHSITGVADFLCLLNVLRALFFSPFFVIHL